MLYDQSHHMAELWVEGPDATKLLSRLGINSFANFPPDRAEHFVACSPEGYVIGDMILFHIDENVYNLVGRAPSPTWVRFHAETGGYEVVCDDDPRSPWDTRGRAVRRRHYRFQVQGPLAWQLLEKLSGGPLPETKFFHTSHVRVAGRVVRALRHGMAGMPGLELWGPYADYERIRDAIAAAGEEFGLRLCGSRA